MKDALIIAHRLKNQRLIGEPFRSPEEVVRHFGAMQAQDHYGAKLAVAQRCGSSDAEVEKLFNSGKILRTHLCRPTWHFVLPEDIRWILELTKPRVHQANAFMCRKFGLDAKLLNRATDLIAKALQGGKNLDRDALVAVLQKARIDTSEFRSVHYMMHAELEGVICSGPRLGKQFTYALLDERVPKMPALKPDEALAELTRRYFNSRGPASLSDFSLWSGLTAAQAKRGMASVQDEFSNVRINGRDNWYPKDATPLKVPANTVHLLPNYDEYGIGYKDRSAFFDPTVAGPGGARQGPIFTNALVVNGRMAGTWERTVRKASVRVTVSPFVPLTDSAQAAVGKAIKRYAEFLDLPLEKTG